MPRRFQFTIRGLLGATFWAAVSAAGWIAIHWNGIDGAALVAITLVAVAVAPFLMVISLGGWTVRSIRIGAYAAVVGTLLGLAIYSLGLAVAAVVVGVAGLVLELMW